jgi:hypothetical protein
MSRTLTGCMSSLRSWFILESEWDLPTALVLLLTLLVARITDTTSPWSARLADGSCAMTKTLNRLTKRIFSDTLVTTPLELDMSCSTKLWILICVIWE